jgi:hypothetical protein
MEYHQKLVIFCGDMKIVQNKKQVSAVQGDCDRVACSLKTSVFGLGDIPDYDFEAAVGFMQAHGYEPLARGLFKDGRKFCTMEKQLIKSNETITIHIYEHGAAPNLRSRIVIL